MTLLTEWGFANSKCYQCGVSNFVTPLFPFVLNKKLLFVCVKCYHKGLDLDPEDGD